MEFSRQEYWIGLPCPPPGDLPDPEIKPGSPALQTDSLPSEPPGKPLPLTWKEQIPLESITLMNCKTFLYQDWVSETQWGQESGWEGLLGSEKSPLKQHKYS